MADSSEAPYWTEDEKALLSKLWGHYSCSEIARQLGNRTRNSVIGKAHRMKLKVLPSPIKRSEFQRVIVCNHMPEKTNLQCDEPDCTNLKSRGSYCKQHADIYYVPRKSKEFH